MYSPRGPASRRGQTVGKKMSPFGNQNYIDLHLSGRDLPDNCHAGNRHMWLGLRQAARQKKKSDQSKVVKYAGCKVKKAEVKAAI